jgi:hypothetical protein
VFLVQKGSKRRRFGEQIEQLFWGPNNLKMFESICLNGRKLIHFCPKRRQTSPFRRTKPTKSEHCSNLFVCPTIEHFLLLSIRQEKCSWDHLMARMLVRADGV